MRKIAKWVMALVATATIGLASGVNCLAQSMPQGDANTCIRDINGDLVDTGKEYYIVSAKAKHQGLTYEKSWFWNYIRLSQSKDTKTIDGTPVKLYTESNFGIDGMKILPHDRVFFKMNDSYFDFGSTNTWVWLAGESKKSSAKMVQDSGKNEVSFAVSSATYYYDKYGRPCDAWQADRTVTSDTYFELTSIDASGRWKDPDNKLWLMPYQHTKQNADKFYLVPVKK